MSGSMELDKQNCYCGSGSTFATCCKPLLTGAKIASTAEQMMRSRYSAFSTRNSDYLILTHHPGQRRTDDKKTLPNTLENSHWLELKIVDTSGGKEFDDVGTVEFIAKFEQNAKIHLLHERSNFVREGGRWFYVDGEHFETSTAPEIKLRRNDPCWCGSGKKYKKCHANS